jgi:hypothetical protein
MIVRNKLRLAGQSVVGAGVLTLLLAACGAGLGAQPGTGIEGLITTGPMCPNQQSPCPDRPVATEVLVLDVSGQQVTTFKSDSTGHFKVDLPPGTYTLKPVTSSSAPGVPPYASVTTVTVVQGKYTSVQLRFDTGIR